MWEPTPSSGAFSSSIKNLRIITILYVVAVTSNDYVSKMVEVVVEQVAVNTDFT